VEDNMVNGKSLVYLEDASDYKVENAGQVILLNCTNISVENLDLSNTSVGIELRETEDSTISNNTIYNNRNGIRLKFSGNNTITGNTACHNDNTGIHLYSSCKCIITGNNISNNGEGLYLNSSGSNKVFLNNFIKNNNTFFSYKSTNIWNSPSEMTYIYKGTTYESYLGNYWHDYEEKYPDAKEIDTTGIWDTPYSIYKDKDFYPLVEPRERYLVNKKSLFLSKR
jgi:parallel beta-helix repeat protein